MHQPQVIADQLAAAGASAGAPAVRMSPARYAGLLCAVFTAALVFRSPNLLFKARMWAEEGQFYYAFLQDLPLTGALTLVVRGNYQLLLNLAAALAVRVPAVWAAYVTTGFALMVAWIVVALVARLASERGWSVAATCAGVVAMALLPQGYEIYLTSTNVQWLASISMALLAALSVGQWTRSQRVAAVAWAGVCALSGVPSVVLAPVLLARGVIDRSRVHLVMGALLALGAGVQLAIILTHTHQGRQFTLDPFVTVTAFFSQAIISPIFGVRWTEQLLAAIRFGHGPVLLVAMLTSSAVAAWLVMRAVAITAAGSRLASTLGTAAVLTATVNVFGSIGEVDTLVSSWSGGRYFILAAVCWLLLLCGAASHPRCAVRVVALACLAISIGSGIREARQRGWNDFLLTGTSWRATVKSCHDRRPCAVQVWPGGEGWTFQLTRP